MNYGQLRSHIADMLQRDLSSFVDGTIDNMATAIHNGMRSVQRQLDLELCRTWCTVQFPADTGRWKITNGQILVGFDNEEAEIKRFLSAYVENDDGSKTPIRVVGAEFLQKDRLERREAWSDFQLSELESQEESTYYYCNLVRDGEWYYFDPLPNKLVTVRFNVIRWLADMVSETDGNFLLSVAPDVVVYHVCSELNLFLKEDERIPLSDAFYRNRFNSLKIWNSDQSPEKQNDIPFD